MRTPKQSRKSLRTEARALVETCAGWNSRLAARRITLFLDRELAGLGRDGGSARPDGADRSDARRHARRIGRTVPAWNNQPCRAISARWKRHGLIASVIVEADLRRRAVWLTETGARRLEAAIPIWRRANARLAAYVPPTLARQLADATNALTQT